jgi:hypothetical protein
VSEPALASRNLILGWAKETENGGPDNRPRALGIAARDGIGAEWVDQLFDEAEEAKKQAQLAAAERSAALQAIALRGKAIRDLIAAKTAPASPSAARPPTVTRREAVKAAEEPLPEAASSFLPATQPVGEGKPVAGLPVPVVVVDEPKARRSPVLDRNAPLDIARRFVREECSRGGVLTLRYWQGVFYRWVGTHYEELANGNGEHPEVRGMIYSYLDGARKAGGGDQNPFQPKPADVSNVLDCLKSVVGLPIEVQPPMWLGDGGGGRDWVAFKNKVLNVVTGEAREHSPDSGATLR